MQVNGLKIPWPVLVGVLTFTFWLGGLSYTVFAQEGSQEKHEEQPGHTQTMTDMATMKADMRNVKESVARIEKQAKEDKREILEAIRSQ